MNYMTEVLDLAFLFATHTCTAQKAIQSQINHKIIPISITEPISQPVSRFFPYPPAPLPGPSIAHALAASHFIHSLSLEQLVVILDSS